MVAIFYRLSASSLLVQCTCTFHKTYKQIFSVNLCQGFLMDEGLLPVEMEMVIVIVGGIFEGSRWISMTLFVE